MHHYKIIDVLRRKLWEGSKNVHRFTKKVGRLTELSDGLFEI